jgi:hypothetical protein
MRQVASADPGLADRLTVAVDPSADSVSWDDAVARFLLAYVRKQATSTVDAAAAEPVDLNTSAATERQTP